MPDRMTQQLAVPVLDQHGLLYGKPAADSEILIAELLYLFKNVAAADKNSLIISRINRRFEKFDLAACWARDEIYFEEFLRALDLEQLQRMKAMIKQPYDQKMVLDRKTEAAFKYVFEGQEISSPKLVIEDAGKLLLDGLTSGAAEIDDRQYLAANRSHPYRKLEKREFAMCDEPCAELFSTYIPLLADSEKRLVLSKMRQTFTAKIEGKISAFRMQKWLLLTADYMADRLAARNYAAEANNIRQKLQAAGYVRPKRDKASFMQKILQQTKKITATTAASLLFRKQRVAPAPMPVANYANITKPQSSDAENESLQALQDLYSRAAIVKQRIAEESAVTQPEPTEPAKNVTFAYKPDKSGFHKPAMAADQFFSPEVPAQSHKLVR